MNKKFTKKLAAYSALAAGAVVVGGSANAQIVYVDINPDETYNADHQLDIDLNTDGINDFSILVGVDLANRNAVRVQPATGNEILGSVGGSFFYPFAMNLNDVIDQNQTVWNGTMNGSYATMAWVYVAGGSYGNWLSATDKYLGVRFFIGTDLHYGWIRFDVTCNATGATLVYKDFAYNSVADQSILAGQMTIGVDNASLQQTKVYTAGDNLFVTFKQPTEGSVSVINMLGQDVITSAINDIKMEMPLEGLEAGIYLVTITAKEGTYTQKIYVK